MRFHSGRFCLRVNIRKASRITESAIAPRPDDRQQEEEGLKIPLVGEVERRLEEDHQEDGVAGPGERERLVVVEPVEDQPPPTTTSVAKTTSGQRNSQSRYRTNRR